MFMPTLLTVLLGLAAADVPDPAQYCANPGGDRLSEKSLDRLIDFVGPSTWRSKSGTQNPPTPAEKVAALMEDPAVRCNFGVLQEPRFRDALGPVTLTESIDLKLSIARNLYFRQQPVTVENVETEAAHIRAQRQALGDFDPFRGRNVVVAASDEQAPDGRQVFGRAPLLQRLGRVADGVTLVREGQGERALHDAISGTERLTVLFEGHGNTKGLKFDGVLKARKLAKMLADRADLTEQVVIVVSACQSHTLARELLQHDIGPAMLLVSEEFGQDLVRPLYNDPFLHEELGLASRTSSIGDILSRASRQTSAYLADGANGLMQIF